jgi:hypothetical protein
MVRAPSSLLEALSSNSGTTKNKSRRQTVKRGSAVYFTNLRVLLPKYDYFFSPEKFAP